MKAGVITQARTTSSRLPGKVLLQAAGRTLLDHHLDRLESSGLDVYVATTSNSTDDPIVAVAENRGLPWHRGSEEDVLARFAGTVRQHGLDVVVRVTSDCPLIDGQLVAEGLQTYLDAADPWTYVSNALERTYPRGMDFEVFSAEALLDAEARATSRAQREHVTPYLYAGPAGRIRLVHVRRDADASSYRLTLDTAEDLALLRRLIEEHDAASLGVEQLIELLDAHPELVALNAHVAQKALDR